jgi:hypothetical protein
MEYTPMSRGTVLRFHDRPGTSIRVWSGELWLTQEGDARDHYLVAGQCFTLDRGGTALATAMRRAQVSVTPPVRSTYAQRFMRFLSRFGFAHAA